MTRDYKIYEKVVNDIATICREIRYNPRKTCNDCPFMDRKVFPGEHEGCHFRREPHRFDGTHVRMEIDNYDRNEERRKIEEEKRNRSFTLEEVEKMLNKCIENGGRTEDWLNYVDELNERKSWKN